MIRLATAPSSSSLVSARLSLKVPGESSAFALALGNLATPAADDGAVSPPGSATTDTTLTAGERQDPAATGNSLPDAGIAELLQGLEGDATTSPVKAATARVDAAETRARSATADGGGLAKDRIAANSRTNRHSGNRHKAVDPATANQPTADPDLPTNLALPAASADTSVPVPPDAAQMVPGSMPSVPDAPMPLAPPLIALSTPATPGASVPSLGQATQASQAQGPIVVPTLPGAASSEVGDTSLPQLPATAQAAGAGIPAQHAKIAVADATISQLVSGATLANVPGQALQPAPGGGAPAVALAPSVAPQPVANPTPAGTAQAQALAGLAAMVPGLAPTGTDQPRERREAGASTAGIEALLGASAPAAAAPSAVQPTGDSQQPTLDLHRHDWMANMIDQIETLRDADGAKSARIRLTPDALGTVDVSLRQDGGTLHVHFASDSAATRTLLGDAAPGLAQLAEARGIRLAQASVETGAGSGQSGGQRQDAPRVMAAAPPSALADADDELDQRIA